MLFLNQGKGENDRRKYFMIRMLPTRWGSNPQPPDHQSDAHLTEPSKKTDHRMEEIHRLISDLPGAVFSHTASQKWFSHNRTGISIYHIYPIKCLDTLPPYHTCSKVWTVHFTGFWCLNPLDDWAQFTPWSYAAVCGIWSGSTQFARACLSKYLG